MVDLIAIILLLIINGFFVAAEFALVKVKPFRIEKLAESGGPSARMAAKIINNLESYLATCQLGITMASLGLGWVAEPAVEAFLTPIFNQMGIPEELLHTVSFLVGFLLFSSLHIIIGEQVPKSYAIRRADTVSLWVAYPLHITFLMVWPLNWALDKASKSILSLFKVEEATHGEIYTDDELQDLVSSSRNHGSIEHVKAEMLNNIFEFDSRCVSDIMVPDHLVKVLDLSASQQENRQIIVESNHSRFPLIDSANNNKIKGIVLVKTIYSALIEEETSDALMNLSDYCLPPFIVPEKQKLSPLFEQMRQDRNHIAIVVDEYGSFSGIVTLEDLLEEIVGDIEDETDDVGTKPTFTKVSDNTWKVDGRLSLSDFNRKTGLSLGGSNKANTLSGLVVEKLGRFPLIDDIIIEGDYKISVLTITEHHADTVLIEQEISTT
jgi:CBS domain containing-hemolysin-like protein